MKHRILVISLLIVSCLCCGCKKKIPLLQSREVEQNTIFQHYQASYNAESQKLTLKASFHVDLSSGTIIELSDSSHVKCNGTTLSIDDNGNYVYTGKYQTKLPIVYVDNDLNTYSNELITNTIEFNQDNISLSTSEVSTFKIKAEPFVEEESVSLRLVSGKSDFEFNIEPTDNSLSVYPEDLTDIPAGTYKANLVRKYQSNQVSGSDRGGIWESEYVSKTKTITIQ